MNEEELLNLRIANHTGIMESISFSCPSVYPVTSDSTNIAYRIATFLHIMKGSNRLDFLSRYSQHVVQYSDNMEQLRGAYGPRMRNWIGAHQLQEMININSSISADEDIEIEENIVDYEEDGTPIFEQPQFVKPVGIDQMMAVFDDLSCGMEETTIVIRDPGVDFEESDDIPDLISISFVSDNNILRAIAQYGTGNNENFQNEIWALHHMVQLYSTLVGYTKYRFSVNSYVWKDGPFSIDNLHDCKINKFSICNGSEGHFWSDLEIMQEYAKHIQCYLNEKTFDNPDVSNEWCNKRLHEYFIDKMDNVYIKDMAYALAIWAFWTYGDSNPTYAGDYESQIEQMFGQMHETSIRTEVAEFLHNKSLPASLINMVKDVYDEQSS